MSDITNNEQQQIKMIEEENVPSHSPINFSDDDLILITDRFRMLSKVSRLKIIKSLFDGEKSVTGIVEASGLLQANVSKQLRLLQNHGFVECRPVGLMRFYRIDDPVIYRICSAVCSDK